MATLFDKKHILLGITGSIAAYKSADLASKLAQAGSILDVILTQSAQQFVTPLTFQSVTGRRAYVDADMWGDAGHVLHVGLGHRTELVIIAPATANTLAKLAHGMADNLLTVTALAARCPLLVAPAMDGGMFSHPATQTNLEILHERGVFVAGPAEGHLASGLLGTGRMVEPADLLGHIRWILGRNGPLKGRNVIVTAGGTQEPIDPVRVVANRSSGKQGFAIAQAALDLGAQVTLVAAPASLSTPVGAKRVEVRTAQEMCDAVVAALPGADVLVMAAAVADFRPVDPSTEKIKKETGIPEVRLERTPDILQTVAEIKSQTGYPKVTVGFAAESEDLLENALHKLQAKRLDLIVANDITASDAGFSVNTNRVVLLDRSGGEETIPLMEKEGVARMILERVTSLLAGPQPDEH